MGGFFVFHATHWGPWAFSDSAAYLSAARNYSAGKGLVIINSNGSVTRVTEFAPLYPIILSLLTGHSSDFLQTARLLDIVSFAISIIGIGSLIFSATRNYLAACLAALLMAVSPIMLDAFNGLMSEPFFILLMIIFAFLLWSYLSRPKWMRFAALIIVTLLLPLTRYAGIIFPVTAGILIILLGKKDFRRNFLKGLGFIAITLLPIALWFLDLYFSLDKVGGKHFKMNLSIYGSFFRSLYNIFLVFRTWFPYFGVYQKGSVNLLIEIFFLLLVTLAFLIGIYRAINDRRNLVGSHYLFITSSVLFVGYLAFVAFSHAITIPQIDIINRTLSPALPLFLLVVSSVYALESRNNSNLIWQLPLALLILLIGRYEFLLTTNKAVDYHENGFGFNSREIQESGFLVELKKLNLEQPMISNDAAFVLFHTNRFPINISQFHNRTYGSDDAYGEKTFREKNAPLIIQLPDFYNTYGSDADRLLSTITEGLVVSYTDPIGAIYYYPK